MSKCNTFNFQQGTCSEVNLGFNFCKKLTYNDSSGAAIDLTGFTLSGLIKDDLGGNIIISLPEVSDNDTTGLYIPDRATGEIYLQIKSADTAQDVGQYPYQLVITDPNTDSTPFLIGTIQFYDRGF